MDTSFGATYKYEMGPLTLGYERWASLSPDIHELQSFGHASVSEEGTLEIKLMGIDGSVMFEKTLTPVLPPEELSITSVGVFCSCYSIYLDVVIIIISLHLMCN
jgi:hypothetical protein